MTPIPRRNPTPGTPGLGKSTLQFLYRWAHTTNTTNSNSTRCSKSKRLQISPLHNKPSRHKNTKRARQLCHITSRPPQGFGRRLYQADDHWKPTAKICRTNNWPHSPLNRHTRSHSLLFDGHTSYHTTIHRCKRWIWIRLHNRNRGNPSILPRIRPYPPRKSKRIIRL